MSDESTNQDVPAKPEVVVIGGGLAGLTAAAIVASAGKSVIVHEKRSTVGGDARSITKEGFTFNLGPHALFKNGPTDRILATVGIKIRGGRPPANGRLMFNDRTEIAPSGPLSLLQTKALTFKEKVEVGKTLTRIPKLQAPDFNQSTVADWIADSVSSHRSAETLRAFMRLTTYSNKPDLLSADIAIAQLQAGLNDGVLYLDNGWQSLVNQLRTVDGVHIATGQEITSLPDAPAVIVASGGAPAAERLLNRSFDVGPPATVSCLDLGLNRRPQHDFIIGGDIPFYFSNHSTAADLAPSNHFHAAAVQYLATGDRPDADALQAFASHAGVHDDDIVVSRRLHQMTAISALPTAERGGLAGRPRITDTGHANVFLAGDWVGPTGLLADASVASAEAAAYSALAILERRTTS